MSSSLPSIALLVNKPEGITSHTLTKKISHHFSLKAGHTGTLDKFATGLMIILLGKATKLSQFFMGLNKTYEAIIKLGEQTSTLDPEGTLEKTRPLPQREEFEKAFNNYKGALDQEPPIYSAIHICGKRAWRYAQSGDQVSIPKRRVKVLSSGITMWKEPFVHCMFSVSSGTYIRSLARDIALASNTVAYVYKLKRTQIHSIHLSEAVSLKDIEKKQYNNAFIPADTLLSRVNST